MVVPAWHTGYWSGGCTLLSWARLVGWVTLSPSEYVAPGFGISVVLLGAFGFLVDVETVVGGLVVGLARR